MLQITPLAPSLGFCISFERTDKMAKVGIFLVAPWKINLILHLTKDFTQQSMNDNHLDDCQKNDNEMCPCPLPIHSLSKKKVVS